MQRCTCPVATQTNLVCKFPCSLNLPIWSGPPLFSVYLFFLCLRGRSAKQQSQSRRYCTCSGWRERSQQEAVDGPEAFFKKWLFSSLVSAGADITNSKSYLAGFLPTGQQDFLINKTFMHFLLVYNFFLKLTLPPWPLWLSWIEHHPINCKAAGSIPGQGTYLGCRFGSQSGHVWEATDPRFSLTSMFLFLSPSLPFPLSLKSISMSLANN